MEKFAFMLHALDAGDVARKYPIARYFPDAVVEKVLSYMPPVVTSRITGVRSPYAEAEGWFVGCTLTTRQFLTLPTPFVLQKIIRTGRLAERLGARILGLGAYTSIVGDAGITVARNLNIAVTTGNSYTVATALEGTREAARFMGHLPETAEFAVVGATGSIGAACAIILAREVRSLTLIGRNTEKLDRLARRVTAETGLAPRVTTDLKGALPRMDVIITVSSAAEAIIEAMDLKPGAVVCDVARPRDVSRRVAEERDDVLVIEGGVVEVPGPVDFHLNFGFPPRTAMACMAETMILALEGRYENFTLGRDITVEQVDEISRLARKHGFRLAGLRSFERALTETELQEVRRRAREKLGLLSSSY